MIPYTYLILQISTGMCYYGSQYGKKANPADLGITYFSSSKLLKPLIKANPSDFIFQVRRTFSNPEQARRWEVKVLRRIKVTENKKWYNQSIENERFMCKGHTSKSRKKMSVNNSGSGNPMYGKQIPESSRKKHGEWVKLHQSGVNNPFYGKHHSEENRAIMSDYKKGVPLSKEHADKIGESIRKGGKLKGRKFKEESLAKMKKSWTAERRKAQSDRTRAMNESKRNRKILCV